jgi:hypothetical protein
MKEIVQDKYSNTIYLTDERWQHIVRRHPPLRNFKTEVLKTIRAGKREQSIYYPNKFLYRRAFKNLPLPYSHIEVAVIFGAKGGKPNNFVVTAYPIIIG